MNKVFKYSALFLVISLLIACGKAKSPTGGPQDKEALKIISIYPDNYASLSGKKIEIIFNKEVNSRSALNAFKFYPDIESYKVKCSDNQVKITIEEELLTNRNYYLTISTLLKDTRNNLLEKSSTYTFSNGKLHDSRLFGDVVYSNEEDRAFAKKLILLDQDSLTVFIKSFTKHNYDIDGLEPRPYIIRSFIDKNNNGRYDIEKEPYFEKYIDSLKTEKADIVLSYRDTSRVVCQKAVALNNRLIQLTFSEDLAKWDSLSIVTVDDSVQLSFSTLHLEDNIMSVITSPQDTLEYQVSLKNLLDFNMNLNSLAKISFKGNTYQDTLNLKVIKSLPKNGSTVSSSKPEIQVRFSQIVLQEDLIASLKENESNKYIELVLVETNSFSARFLPKDKLKNFNSYTFSVSKDTKDFLGNNLTENLDINFMITAEE